MWFFFPTHRLVRPFARQIQLRIQQASEAGRGIRQGYAVDTVFDLPAIAVVLPFHTGRFGAALDGSRFVDATDGLWMRVFTGDNLLAAITQLLLTPHQGFEEPLERARWHLLIQGDGLGILALHARQ
jgi:hypothetical protein